MAADIISKSHCAIARWQQEKNCLCSGEGYWGTPVLSRNCALPSAEAVSCKTVIIPIWSFGELLPIPVLLGRLLLHFFDMKDLESYCALSLDSICIQSMCEELGVECELQFTQTHRFGFRQLKSSVLRIRAQERAVQETTVKGTSEILFHHFKWNMVH